MRVLRYASGQHIRTGDRVTYHGEPGEVEFVVTERTGDVELDSYLEQFPAGGVMVRARGFGRVFVGDPEVQEDLLFVGSGGEAGQKGLA